MFRRGSPSTRCWPKSSTPEAFPWPWCTTSWRSPWNLPRSWISWISGTRSEAGCHRCGVRHMETTRYRRSIWKLRISLVRKRKSLVHLAACRPLSAEQLLTLSVFVTFSSWQGDPRRCFKKNSRHYDIANVRVAFRNLNMQSNVVFWCHLLVHSMWRCQKRLTFGF